MDYIHMKRFSTSLVTKKMQIKTTMRHYLTPTRMKLKIQLKILIENTNKHNCCQKCGEIETLKHFPQWLRGKESACYAGDAGWSLGQEDSCKRKWQPTPVILPGKSQRLRNPATAIPGVAGESTTTERLNNSTHCWWERQNDTVAPEKPSSFIKEYKILRKSTMAFILLLFIAFVHNSQKVEATECLSTDE